MTCHRQAEYLSVGSIACDSDINYAHTWQVCLQSGWHQNMQLALASPDHRSWHVRDVVDFEHC